MNALVFVGLNVFRYFGWTQRLGHRPSTTRSGQTIWCMRREQLPLRKEQLNTLAACNHVQHLQLKGQVVSKDPLTLLNQVTSKSLLD